MQEWHTRAGLTTVWRNQAMSILLFPPALIEYERTPALERASWWSATIADEPSPSQIGPPRQRHIIIYLAAICFLGTASLFTWVQSLAFTTTVRASLFSSLYPIILMMYFRYFKGVRHSTGELVGVAVAVAGIAMALLDPSLTSANSPGGYSAIVGDLMYSIAYSLSLCFESCVSSKTCHLFSFCRAVLSAVLLAINILLAKYVRKILPVFSYVWATMFARIFILAFYSCVAEGSSVSFDIHVRAVILHVFSHKISRAQEEYAFCFSKYQTGIFGWLDPSRTRPVMLFAAAAGYFGIVGWNFCLKYIDPVVFSTVGLADPVLTGYISYFIGLEGTLRCCFFEFVPTVLALRIYSD